MACSTAHQVSSDPRMMIDSLRRPLANGSQKAVNTAAAAQMAQALRRTPAPRRGNKTRDRMNHDPRPARSDGMRIHSPEADTSDQRARNE